MAWSCKTCTFENDKDQQGGCSMCGETRQRPEAGGLKQQQKKTSKSTKQTTLLSSFGGSSTSSSAACRSHSFSKHVRTTIPDQTEIDNTLKSVFGLKKLRSLQSQVVETAACQRQSQLVVLATGGGKSLCYQLPACLLGGVTIVISPLIALMQDQVASLRKQKIPAACLCSANTETQNKTILEELLQPNQQQSIVFLYITPESIQTTRMQRILFRLKDQNRLAMFAVDEAHCLSSWGHDFRPAYRKLSWLRASFASVPCMACTATATPKVVQDIQSCLQLSILHQGRLDRHNIYYKVQYKNTSSSSSSSLQDLIKTIQKLHQQQPHNCSGIIYVHKRDDTSMLATAIGKALKNNMTKVAAYHGGLAKKERQRVLEGFVSNQIPFVVATVAFGMGIDVANVRLVIHWNMPKSLEAFAQESGRAGRDGLPSRSILYYCPEDYSKFQFLLRKQQQVENESSSSKKQKQPQAHKLLQAKLKALDQMKDYCVSAKCRRNAIASHFGGGATTTQPVVDCQKTCDYCANPQKIAKMIQMSLVTPPSTKRGQTQFAKKAKWDGQWNGPHGSNSNEERIASDWGDGFVGDLQVTGSSKNSSGRGGGFTTASSMLHNNNTKKLGGKNAILSVLSKYENMEEENESNKMNDGFVRFGANNRSTTAIIPEHFKAAAAAAASLQLSKKRIKAPAQPKQKSALELQNDLDRINAERQVRMQALLAKQKKRKEESTAATTSSTTSVSKAPPPPPLTFGTSKRRRKN